MDFTSKVNPMGFGYCDIAIAPMADVSPAFVMPHVINVESAERL